MAQELGGDKQRLVEEQAESPSTKQNTTHSVPSPDGISSVGGTWLKTPEEVNHIWRPYQLCRHVPVRLDGYGAVEWKGEEHPVILMERFEGRLFVMEVKAINEDIHLEEAREILEVGSGARVVDKDFIVPESEGLVEVLCFADLDRDIGRRKQHVVLFRYVEVNEFDHFLTLEGKLEDEMSSYNFELAKKKGGWQVSKKDDQLYPPGQYLQKPEKQRATAPIAAAGSKRVRFPFLANKPDTTRSTRRQNGGIFLPKVKESGHATLMDGAGKTIGDDPDQWAQAFGSTIAVDKKHPGTGTKTSLVLRPRSEASRGSHDVAGRSSAAEDFGKRKRTRSAAEREEAKENTKSEKEVEELRKESQASDLSRKKAKTTESDAKGGAEGSATDKE